MAEPKIAAVVVTNNRLKLLQDCISALLRQTRPCNHIIVVDNGSSDGTREWCSAGSKEFTYVTQSNEGSAGGQATGIATALEMGCDWVWCMDDDSLPQKDSLAELCRCPHFRDETTGFLGSVVLWKDGSLHKMNLLNPAFVGLWLNRVLADGCLPVLSASFVGIMINKRAVESVGLPLRSLFIWGDDIEYTRRITSRFKAYAVLKSIVVHQTASNDGAGTQLSPLDCKSIKFWCQNRNLIALELFAGGNILKNLKSIAICMVRQLREAKTLEQKFVATRAFCDGFRAFWANRHFRLPLGNNAPIERLPVVWPAPLSQHRE